MSSSEAATALDEHDGSPCSFMVGQRACRFDAAWRLNGRKLCLEHVYTVQLIRRIAECERMLVRAMDEADMPQKLRAAIQRFVHNELAHLKAELPFA